MSELRCPAVVLATRPLGDADLLVVLLTPELGKIRAAARAARKSRKRFAGGLPGGALGEVTLRRGRSSLWRLEGFASVHDLSILGRDLDRFAYVAYLCELTDVLIVEPEPDPERFAALAEGLAEILDAGPRPSVLRRFEIRLLHTLGLLPILDACCVCGEALPLAEVDSEDEIELKPFDAQRGGALCHDHATPADEVLPAQVLALAAALAEPADAPATLARLDAAPAAIRRALRDLVLTVLRPHLRRPLRSLEFLAQIGSRSATS